jgi:hypothetical protein
VTTLVERARALRPDTILEAFVVANIAFLAVDIVLAHAENGFARSEEWIPIVFSIVATLVLLPGVFSARIRASTIPVAIGVGAACIVIGLAGLILHLESAFFRVQSLKNLVYTAPFAAPLAYVGLGLLLILSRVEKAGTQTWAGWIVFLALGGFAGNLALSLLDHAQNGFYRPIEWIPVAAAAFATSFLAVTLLLPSAKLVRATLAVMALQVVVGVLGFALHVQADLHARGTIPDRVVHGAPIFAPMLFADLALLAGIGLVIMLRAPMPDAEPAPRASETAA